MLITGHVYISKRSCSRFLHCTSLETSCVCSAQDCFIYLTCELAHFKLATFLHGPKPRKPTHHTHSHPSPLGISHPFLRWQTIGWVLRQSWLQSFAKSFQDGAGLDMCFAQRSCRMGCSKVALSWNCTTLELYIGLFSLQHKLSAPKKQTSNPAP